MKKLLITLLGVSAMLWGVHHFVTTRAASQPATGTDKLQVVATNSILADLVQEVGGSHVAVYSIVRRGVDPHEYEPRPSDVAADAEADLLFHNGLNLETGGSGWFKKLVTTTGQAFGKTVFAASEGVTPKHLTTNKAEVDPHAWLDLENGVQYVRTIQRRLSDADPANAAAYQQNADAYADKLMALHEAAVAKFARLPENRRVLVTSEGAFKYFGAAYGVTPTYIWEINTESQGTPAQLQAVLGKLAASSGKHVFVESSVSPKAMQKVAKESGRTIYAKLFTDSLAAAGTTGDTYYTMMKWNLDQIYAGLAG
ncbi:metal ABC transporter solute-binding protein, Zn/Mn family [Lacticaseibacillus kribbianus]|uniref:metal ABC transporter solute-binding protein, Zn/Mn family n=1 Tax=Lacticaseibacillus kribbianus TaxID=2926292 RepID=UPI001CD7E4DA|nr:zinc ABC transporter substrate-binding protein [Lacticaseibacillus kribbianus]